MKDDTRLLILVVEDEVMLLQAIEKKMEIDNIDVVSSVSGKQALEYMGTLPKLPDGIWLDYYLKDMDGLEFMEEIKKNKVWAKIPVVVVSNSASPEKVNRMLALGANEYLVKSDYSLQSVIDTLKDIINKHHHEQDISS